MREIFFFSTKVLETWTIICKNQVNNHHSSEHVKLFKNINLKVILKIIKFTKENLKECLYILESS